MVMHASLANVSGLVEYVRAVILCYSILYCTLPTYNLTQSQLIEVDLFYDTFDPLFLRLGVLIKMGGSNDTYDLTFYHAHAYFVLVFLHVLYVSLSFHEYFVFDMLQVILVRLPFSYLNVIGCWTDYFVNI